MELTPLAETSPVDATPTSRPASCRTRLKWRFLTPLLLVLPLGLAGCSADGSSNIPGVNVSLNPSANPHDIGTTVTLFIILSVLAISPSLVVMLTGFTRIIIVLSFIRTGLGTPNTPPNQVLLGLAMFLTFFVMEPVWQQVNSNALQPYLNGQISQQAAVDKGLAPIRTFMFKQTSDQDISLYIYMAKLPNPKTQADVPTFVLVPAFVTSELKTAFEMGFMLLLPFLIIDLVVSSALMSMGMLMLSPNVVSLPFKLLLFVLVDGWSMIIQSLVQSFH